MIKKTEAPGQPGLQNEFQDSQTLSQKNKKIRQAIATPIILKAIHQSGRVLRELLIKPFLISVALPPPEESPKCRKGGVSLQLQAPLALFTKFSAFVQNFDNQISTKLQYSLYV